MYKVYYKICDVNILVESERELWESDESKAFRVNPVDYDLKFSIKEVDKIPEVPGEYKGKTDDFTIFTQEGKVIRRAKDLFRPLPHALTSYDMDNVKEVNTLVYKDYYNWATSSKYLWTSISINHLLLQFNALFFHSSYIRYKDDGIMFTAASGTGKSTQAFLWEKYKGAEVINGDKAVVRLEDCAKVYSAMFSGTSGINKNISSKLKAIIVLEKGEDNSIKRLSPIEIIKYLLPNIFVDSVIDSEKIKAYDLIIKLSMMVPVYFYSCTKDESAVEKLEEALFGND